MTQHVLVVDDDEQIRLSLGFLLTEENYQVSEAANPAEAFERLKKGHIDLVLLDMNYTKDTTSGAEGLEFLSQAQQHFPDINIVVMTAWADLQIVVSAMKKGASDFIEKPWENNRLLQIIHQQFKIATLKRENLRFRSQQVPTQYEKGIEYRSIQMQKLKDTIQRFAKSNASVLITGENGTGKSTLAREIHTLSARKSQSFVEVNMGAIPKDLFESEMFGHIKGAFTGANEHRIGRLEMAEKGTLFLDEVSTLSTEHQAKLLRVLEVGEYEKVGSSITNIADVRIVSASNANFPKLIETSAFRQDLFYRLNTLHIEVPPLRERPEDIEPIALHFLAKFERQYQRSSLSLSPAALRALKQFTWPGNVRELSHVIERSILLCDNEQISTDAINLGPACQPAAGTDSKIMTLEESELALIHRAMTRADGNTQQAANILGISASALYRRLDKYQINVKS